MTPSKTTLETGTTAHTGLSCFAIGFLTDTVLTTCTGLSGDTVSGATWPAGFTLFGNFTAVTASSGSYVIYET